MGTEIPSQQETIRVSRWTRVKHWLLNGCTALSLGLFVATAAFWIRWEVKGDTSVFYFPSATNFAPDSTLSTVTLLDGKRRLYVYSEAAALRFELQGPQIWWMSSGTIQATGNLNLVVSGIYSGAGTISFLPPPRRLLVTTDSLRFTEKPWGVRLELPDWVWLLLFAILPALWWRRRYVAQRNKKLFEEAVESKRLDQKM